MLDLGLALLALAWGLWLTFMIRYPLRWAETVDAIHAQIARCGVSADWMKQAEKGLALKSVVAVTVILVLTCLAILVLHPDALSNFVREHYQ
jgi:hypothetical protein